MTTSSSEQLGKFIHSHREAKGLSMRALAADAKVDFSYIAHLERGSRVQPSQAVLRRLAGALGVQPDDLFTLAGYQLPEELPTLAPYLRAKYDLSDDAVAELERLFDEVSQRSGSRAKRGRR